MEKLEEEGIQVGRLTKATKSIHGVEMAKGQTLNLIIIATSNAIQTTGPFHFSINWWKTSELWSNKITLLHTSCFWNYLRGYTEETKWYIISPRKWSPSRKNLSEAPPFFFMKLARTFQALPRRRGILWGFALEACRPAPGMRDKGSNQPKKTS